MIFGTGYTVGEKGKEFWKDRIDFFGFTSLNIPKDKYDSIKEDFYNNQLENSVSPDKYLVEGVHVQFIDSEEQSLLEAQANSKDSLERFAVIFNLPKD